MLEVIRHEREGEVQEVMLIGGYVRQLDGQQMPNYDGTFYKKHVEPYGTWRYAIHEDTGKVLSVLRL